MAFRFTMIILFLCPWFPIVSQSGLMDYLPGYSRLEYINYQEEGQRSSYSDIDRLDENTWILVNRSDTYELELQFDSNFATYYSLTRYLSEEHIEGSGSREVELIRGDNNVFQINRRTKNDQNRSGSRELGAALDHTLVMLQIQAMLIKAPHLESIELTVYNPYVLREYSLIYTRMEMTAQEILEYSSNYSLPDEMKELLLSQENPQFWVGHLTGIARLIFPHGFYLILDRDNHFQVVMEWGSYPDDGYYSVPTYIIEE